MSDAPARADRRKNVMRLVLAWGGTALLLAYMALTTDLSTAWDAFRNADHVRFVLTLVLAVLGAYLVDSATVVVLLRRVGVRVGLGEFLRVKGASYLLNIVNYNLALVMMAAVVKRRSDRGWGAAGSPFLLLNFLDLSVFGTFVLASTLAGLCPFEGDVALGLGVVAAGAMAGPAVLCGLARLDRAPGLLGRLAGHGLMAAFRRLRWRDLPLMMVLRSTLILLYATTNQQFLRAFQVDIPLPALLVFMPVMTLVSLLPISVGGLGSSQVVARSLFGPYVPAAVAATSLLRDAVVDAVTTSIIVFTMMLRSLIGLACLPWVSRALADARREGEGW